ncbi:MAG TPA: ABC transporter ATP-binding protein [Pirellulaceae bacterium]|nr:ABC transporter ATP-binding protein [Pirellulaceae bacterium]
MLALENVTKLYKTVIGVNDITLHLEPGVYGLLGPNGSGKTTLINLIIGQMRPNIGCLKVFGVNPWMYQSKLRQIGYCPAIEPIYPRVSGLEWTTYLIRLHGFRAAEARRRAIESLEQVGMAHAMNRYMGEYSLGMRQRCKLAQSIAHDPELLILDEPFNGLDPVGRFDMTKYLKQWVRRGRSLILASHILHEVEAVNPSLLLVSGGRLLASGSPEEVRTILADCPNAISIRSSDNALLASELVKLAYVQNVMFHREENSGIINTDSASNLLARVSEIARQHDVTIYEIRAADESLQDVFATLMKLHRGEIQRGNKNANSSLVDG